MPMYVTFMIGLKLTMIEMNETTKNTANIAIMNWSGPRFMSSLSSRRISESLDISRCFRGGLFLLLLAASSGLVGWIKGTSSLVLIVLGVGRTRYLAITSALIFLFLSERRVVVAGVS